MKTRKQWEEERYVENTGRDAETRFPDDPDWKYKGTKADRDALRDRFGFTDEEDEAPVIIEGQEELFSA